MRKQDAGSTKPAIFAPARPVVKGAGIGPSAPGPRGAPSGNAARASRNSPRLPRLPFSAPIAVAARRR